MSGGDLSVKKKGCFALLVFVIAMVIPLTIPVFTAFSSPPVIIIVDGHQVSFCGQEPVIVSNRTLVPVRGVFDMMGFEVYWDSSARIARLTSAEYTIVIPADMSHFLVNGGIITPEVPQRLINDRLMLPLSAIAEAIGASVYWDAANRAAVIISAPGADQTSVDADSFGVPSVMAQPYDNWLSYESQAYEQLINEPPATYEPQIVEYALNVPPEYMPPPERTINDYLMQGRSFYNVLFDVEFFRVEDRNLVPVMSPAYGHGNSTFAVWAELNNKHNIELICYLIFITADVRFHPCGLITGGRFRRVELTLSSDILNYLEDENGLLVIESLAKSFINMWRPEDGIIDIKIIVSGATVYSESASFHLHCC